MLTSRDRENLVAQHHAGATMKQQGKGVGARYPKTPVQVPLNDENTSQFAGGKSVLTQRFKVNENNLMNTVKGAKGADMANFVTPMQPRARAVLGDKTTNAKAKGLAPVNVKNTVQQIEKSQQQNQATRTSRPKQKQQSQLEAPKLQIHAEPEDPVSDGEPEYCPPKPTDLPYDSDVFPDGVLTFEGLKPENMFKGYYQHYFDPVGDDGKTESQRKFEENKLKAMEDGDRRIQEEMDDMDWSVQGVPETKNVFKKSSTSTESAARKPLSTVTAKTAASAMSMDEPTKSLQRKVNKALSSGTSAIPKKKPGLRILGLKPLKRPTALPVSTSQQPRKPHNLEANSRSTIGYSKGRAIASHAAQPNSNSTTKAAHSAATAARHAPKPSSTTTATNSAGLSRSETTSSMDSARTITPALFAKKENQDWHARLPFLSIFNADEAHEDDGFELAPGGLRGLHEEDEEDEEEFQMVLPE